MIILDTHIWVWWVDDSQQLRDRKRQTIQDNVQSGLGVSAISCWEVAKLVEYGRLELACTVETARVYDIPLLTADRRILQYQHVRTL